MANFSQYLQNLREERNLSLRKVASDAKISASLLSRVENGKRGVPKVDTLYSLAQALNVDVDEMLFLAGHKVPPDRLTRISPSQSAIRNMSKEEIDLFRKKEKLENEILLGNIKKPELKRWYLELQNADQEDIEKLKILWEIIKKEK